jgi:hypothetical protein
VQDKETTVSKTGINYFRRIESSHDLESGSSIWRLASLECTPFFMASLSFNIFASWVKQCHYHIGNKNLQKQTKKCSLFFLEVCAQKSFIVSTPGMSFIFLNSCSKMSSIDSENWVSNIGSSEFGFSDKNFRRFPSTIFSDIRTISRFRCSRKT